MDSPLDTQGSEPQFKYIQMIKINFKRSIFTQVHLEKKISEKQKAWNANHKNGVRKNDWTLRQYVNVM